MRQDPTAAPAILETPAGESRLLSRLYREVGLASVAAELELAPADLGAGVDEAVQRGARYLAPKAAILAA